MVSTGLAFPLLIAFGLDKTFWSYWIDLKLQDDILPYKRINPGLVTDHNGTVFEYYKEVPLVLEQIHKRGITMAIVAYTAFPNETRQLLQALDWDKYFKYFELHPMTSKPEMFETIHYDGSIEYTDMLYFDASSVSIRFVKSRFPICTHDVNPTVGLTLKDLDEGLKKFHEKKKHEEVLDKDYDD